MAGVSQSSKLVGHHQWPVCLGRLRSALNHLTKSNNFFFFFFKDQMLFPELVLFVCSDFVVPLFSFRHVRKETGNSLAKLSHAN